MLALIRTMYANKTIFEFEFINLVWGFHSLSSQMLQRLILFPIQIENNLRTVLKQSLVHLVRLNSTIGNYNENSFTKFMFEIQFKVIQRVDINH